MLSYTLLLNNLQSLGITELVTYVEGNPFTMKIDSEKITTVTKSSGKSQHILRQNVETVLRTLMQKGRLTKEEMEGIRGVSGNKATKLFAIIANANLPGVTATDNPKRTLFYSAKG